MLYEDMNDDALLSKAGYPRTAKLPHSQSIQVCSDALKMKNQYIKQVAGRATSASWDMEMLTRVFAAG